MKYPLNSPKSIITEGKQTKYEPAFNAGLIDKGQRIASGTTDDVFRVTFVTRRGRRARELGEGKSVGCVMGGLRSGQGGTWQGWCGLSGGCK